MATVSSQVEGVNNSVSYELYLSNPPSEQQLEQYRQHVTTVTQGQIQEFYLRYDDEQNLCYGGHRFDQNIEEEWLIVYSLFELSKFDRDLVVKVCDNDGDILLIEAAEYLPRWLESSKSKDRVFIYNGKIHIIPENISLKSLQNSYISPFFTSVTHAAAAFIRDVNENQTSRRALVRTLADPAIQNAIQEQLSAMPDKGAWLSKKFKQLDEIISEDNTGEGGPHLQKKFNESLNLASVMAMPDEDLWTSPMSSIESTSSSWLTEQEDN